MSSWKPEDHIPPQIKRILSKRNPNHVLAFLSITQLLKLQKRTGWINNGITNAESISDHMYRMGVMSMLIKNPNVNRDKCVRISLVHDIAESLVGDITPMDPMTKEEKHHREFETVKYLANELIKPYNEIAAKEIIEDWLTYENGIGLEGKYTKDLDKYEMLIQCFEYEQQYNGEKNLDQFYGCANVIQTEEIKQWTKDLLEEREAYFHELTKKNHQEL
ncbi:5'-deoxynucleotidase NDAI_0I01370 [Naumovozyma dairenensis CBS 421]|uniref:5'-deoxynucleotidase n=1 Tax=Naumovozyma dairenensis (strain ATCC 10597 / BCRC 20456 / CBS 421 / NBRC 0211 / NRRL Y-12639) TaxID=1071378 RepID=G0WFZ5_NAUDC|nr:hypothetical protein NDAI_0I01370 [Naumovozyma dairenensis CBS 421]CCD26706.1 hypothetical protein NDAI_0I01370 [Naumovozyma dairenensis CBS 421]